MSFWWFSQPWSHHTGVPNNFRKKLRSEIGKQFNSLSADDLSQLVPNKEDMTVMKISTHSGQTVVVYNVHGNPAFFQVDATVFPTGQFHKMYKQNVQTLAGLHFQSHKGS